MKWMDGLVDETVAYNLLKGVELIPKQVYIYAGYK